MEQTEAILIRRQAWSDTSLIVTWFTLAHGKVGTMAKAARRANSPFAGHLDFFADGSGSGNCFEGNDTSTFDPSGSAIDAFHYPSCPAPPTSGTGSPVGDSEQSSSTCEADSCSERQTH